MSFTTIKDEKQKKELIDQFLKNRKNLKERVIDEKVKKQQFQRDVAAPLQQPIMKQVEKLESQQKKTDESQNKLINQIQQNQMEIVGKMGSDRDALLNRVLENQAIIAQHLALPPDESERAIASGSETSPPRPATIIQTDFDKDLDLDLLRELGLSFPSELVGNPSELKANQETAGRLNQSFGGRNRRGKDKGKFTERINKIKAYIERLKLIKQGQSIIPEKTGEGISKNPYKLNKDSMFGNLFINPEKLNQFHHEAYNGDKKVLSRKMDIALMDLLTKRYNSKRLYSDKSLKTFGKLIELSGLPLNRRSMKFSTVTGGSAKKSTIKYYSGPDELIQRLELLISSKQAGKKSRALDNEIVEILDALLKDGVIDKKAYKLILSNNIV